MREPDPVSFDDAPTVTAARPAAAQLQAAVQEVDHQRRADALDAELRRTRATLAEHVEENLALHAQADDRERRIREVEKELAELKARLGGPRCSACGNLCIDICKDEKGLCPECHEIDEAVKA